MLKKINLNQFKIVTIALFACIVLFCPAVALGQNPTQNPHTSPMIVQYVRNGIPVSTMIDVPGVWSPGLQPWNGKFTVNGPTSIHPVSGHLEKPRIANVATNLTFPIDPGGLNITATEVNAFWDMHYANATRIGEPTWSQNCHGHSTGLGYWVNDFIRVRDYDWELCRTHDRVVVGCVRGEAEHSVRISGVVPADENHARVISSTTEKMSYAGTYRYDYYLPGGLQIYPMLTYRPK